VRKEVKNGSYRDGIVSPREVKRGLRKGKKLNLINLFVPRNG
jgi:hypothetical protein